MGGMSSQTDVRQLDDTALLMQRQAAADSRDWARKRELDAEVLRRWDSLRAALKRPWQRPR